VNVQELIEASERQPSYNWEWGEQTRNRVAEYRPHATGNLRALFPCADRWESNYFDFQSRAPAPPRLLEMAAFGLREYINAETADRLPGLIAAARIEYARAELHAALFASLIAREVRPDRAQEVTEYLARIRARDWNDADAITAKPLAIFDSSAANFNDWLSSVDPETDTSSFLLRDPCKNVDPVAATCVFEAAIVASWIDTALCDADSAPSLTADIIELFGIVRWWHGWDAAHEFQKEERSQSAKKAAHARHQPSAIMKQRAIEEYRKGSYPSKDAAAFDLAKGTIPLSFRVIRDALKGV